MVAICLLGTGLKARNSTGVHNWACANPVTYTDPSGGAEDCDGSTETASDHASGSVVGPACSDEQSEVVNVLDRPCCLYVKMSWIIAAIAVETQLEVLASWRQSFGR